MALNLTFRYFDDVLSINNQIFANWILLINHKELDIQETTDSASSASFLHNYSEFWHQWSSFYQTGRQKRDDFDFDMV